MEDCIIDRIKTDQGSVIIYGLYYNLGYYRDDENYIKEYISCLSVKKNLKLLFVTVDMNAHINIDKYHTTYAVATAYYKE